MKVQAVVFVWSVDRPVRDKAFSCKVLSDKIPHQKNLLGGRQLMGQGDVEAMGKLGILRPATVALDVIKPVPKFGAVVHPQGGVFGGADLRMENAVFAGVVVKALGPFIPQGIAGAIGGSGYDALDLRSSFDGVMKVENRHILPLPEAGSSHESV